MTENTVVLSDPADHVSLDGTRRAARDSVTFWTDPSCEGLEATAARFRNHSFRPHTHGGLMIGLIDAGTKSFMRERKRFFAESGSISVVNAGELHTGSRAEGDELRYRALYIPLAVLAAAAGYAADGDAPEFCSGVVRDEPLFRVLGRAHASIVHGSGRLEREQRLLEGVQMLAGKYGSPRRSSEPLIGAAPRAVRSAYALIDARFTEELSISEIAAAVEISPYHLMRQFRRHVGIPMHALQNQLRVGLGRRLLGEGMPASEVALEVGFADQSHFSKRFKELVGAPPTSYQRNVRCPPYRNRAENVSKCATQPSSSGTISMS